MNMPQERQPLLPGAPKMDAGLEDGDWVLQVTMHTWVHWSPNDLGDVSMNKPSYILDIYIYMWVLKQVGN